MANSTAGLLAVTIALVIGGLIMVLFSANHIGGDIIEGTCECTGERDVERMGRRRQCKVDINGVFPGTNGTASRNLTSTRLHDAPSDCSFCEVGNGTFPCYLNTASDYVGHNKSSHSRIKTNFILGLVALALGVCCCLPLIVLAVRMGARRSEDAYQPDYQLDYSLGGCGYANPAPTPDLGYIYGAQQQPLGCFGPGVYEAQYGQAQQMPGISLAQGTRPPFYGGYYGNPSAF